MVTPNISAKTRRLLGVFKIEAVEVQPLPQSISRLDYLQYSKWRDTPIKFQAFNMTQYKWLIVTDANMYLRLNIDEMFDQNALPNPYCAAQDNLGLEYQGAVSCFYNIQFYNSSSTDSAGNNATSKRLPRSHGIDATSWC